MSKDKKNHILAIESSADETSAAIFGRGKLLSNIVYSQIAQHKKTGGIVPEVAARAHLPKIIPAIELALKKAKVKLADIDAIAVTAGPGLITSLRIGVDTAKALAFVLDKPVIPINHLEGHLLSGLIHNSSHPPLILRGGAKTPSLRVREGGGELRFPALGLIVSGGHTMLVLVKAIGKYQILGETVDDAAGEAFDKTAKLLGLPYPGGPHLAKLATKGNPKKYDFPRAMLDRNNFDFSFSGLKTAVLYFLRENSPNPSLEKRGTPSLLQREGGGGFFADVAASVEQAIVDVLVAKTVRAARDFKVKTILLGGGVSANKKLQRTLKKQISQSLPDSKFLIPDSSLTTDNAGMIAAAAWHHFRHGHITTFDKVNADPNLELRSWR